MAKKIDDSLLPDEESSEEMTPGQLGCYPGSNIIMTGKHRQRFLNKRMFRQLAA